MCSTTVYLLSILLLLLFCSIFSENSAHPSSCPPTQFSCGNHTWNVSFPFFTNSTTNPGCRNVHYIYCQNDSPVVQFYNTGFVYAVRDISLPSRTIVVHDFNLNSYSWESDCVFLYNFTHPIPAINLTQLTLSTKKTLTSFSCDKIESYNYNQTIFGDSLGRVSCKNYTLFLPKIHNTVVRMIFLLIVRVWETSDCFGCNVTAGSSCTTSGNPGDLDSRCQCTKQCRGDGKRKKRAEKWVIIEKLLNQYSLTHLFHLFIFSTHILLPNQIGASGGAAAGVLISILCILLCKRRRTKNHSPSSIHLVRDSRFETHYVDTQLCSADYKTHIFSYAELDEATDGFSPSQVLGDGGFGTVYKGKLRDGRIVAVKRLYENNYKQVEQFMNEIDILSLSATKTLSASMAAPPATAASFSSSTSSCPTGP
uniref:Protein kinase domain-containing protein n=1 Tax=Ananas comosus var. bracteatus TaxID=296719 RepID=A0A6V7PVT2_ANACO|nr:unnamed protein product [Ananas comosus var. bracteatus]